LNSFKPLIKKHINSSSEKIGQDTLVNPPAPSSTGTNPSFFNRFLINGLNEFNQWPHFTSFNFCDAQITGLFSDIVIQGAYLLAVAAQSLIERGREFSINDNGVTYQPPIISEILTTQYNTQLAYYKEKLKAIKTSLKPAPKGLGTFRVTAISPNFLRLRHLRERQIL